MGKYYTIWQFVFVCLSRLSITIYRAELDVQVQFCCKAELESIEDLASFVQDLLDKKCSSNCSSVATSSSRGHHLADNEFQDILDQEELSDETFEHSLDHFGFTDHTVEYQSDNGAVVVKDLILLDGISHESESFGKMMCHKTKSRSLFEDIKEF